MYFHYRWSTYAFTCTNEFRVTMRMRTLKKLLAFLRVYEMLTTQQTSGLCMLKFCDLVCHSHNTALHYKKYSLHVEQPPGWGQTVMMMLVYFPIHHSVLVNTWPSICKVTLLLQDNNVNTCYPTSVQLTTTADQSLNGYMVASREDTGTELDGNVSYVGSWEQGTGMKVLCNRVSTSVLLLLHRQQQNV